MRYDVLIVGSGASAVNAAYPLVEAGLSVCMLDVGNSDSHYAKLVPHSPFLETRTTDSEQHRYFLGEAFEGIALGETKPGAGLTPPRQFITKDTHALTPVDSSSLKLITTLARGGLASGWGAGAYAFSRSDMRDFPISLDDLAPHFEAVSKRIGISGAADDLTQFDGALESLLPPLTIDQGAASILSKYEKKRSALNAAGLYLGRTRLAALSVPYRGRGKEEYRDMSFWSDGEKSVWRPHYTLAELLTFSNFSYHAPILVESFEEQGDKTVLLKTRELSTNTNRLFHAKKIILAGGVFGTARIVLTSLKKYETKIPFAANPYTYYPMINMPLLGSAPAHSAMSLAPLSLVYTPKDGSGALHGRVHGYRSLLNFKVIKEMPLPYREAMKLMRTLLTSLTILAIDHEDRPSDDKYCVLHRGSPDRLQVEYALDAAVRAHQIQHEKQVVRHLRALGCIALKRVWPGYGASLHYGGTFPMEREHKSLATSLDGRLYDTNSVHIVDGSVFPYLPAKGLTFTMMANANRIATSLAGELKQTSTDT